MGTNEAIESTPGESQENESKNGNEIREELAYFEPEIDWELDDDTLEAVSDIEGQIEALMQETQGTLDRIEEGDEAEIPEGAFEVSFRDNALFITEEGEEEKLSLGQLLTDSAWGVQYHLDATVPVEIKRRYILENAKATLKTFTDRKLLLQQLQNPHIDGMKRETYRRILRDQKEGNEHFGLIAEKMVKNFFKKLTIDEDIGFEVHEASVIQDVEQKVDFILHRKSHYRGVGVEAKDVDESDLGVQFTVADGSAKLWHKKGQLEKVKHEKTKGFVEDIVLVTMDKRQFSTFYNRWLKDKKPGGPDRLWHLGIKEEIFKRTLRKFLSTEEIDATWQSIEKGV